VCALLYASRQIREARDEAQIQHLLTLDHEYQTEPYVKYRRVYAQKRLAGEDDPDEGYQILDFFEPVALLANDGYLNDTHVWETFGVNVLYMYADEKENIEQARKDDPSEYSNLSLLVPRLEAIEVSHHGKSAKPSEDEIRDFWEDESKLGVSAPVSRSRRANAKH
jgi:hypothetical protein